MTSGPRILFASFADVKAKSAMWSGHSELVRGIPDVEFVMSSGPFIVWQLVTANGRSIARAVSGFSSFEDADRDARYVVCGSDTLQVEMVTNPISGMHGWAARLGGEYVAVCSRWYASERDSCNASSLAIASLPVAQIATSSHFIGLMPRSVSA